MPQNRKVSNKFGTGCVILFLLPFALCGLWFAFLTLKLLLFWYIAQGWVECPAWIDRVELKSDSDGEGTTYNVVAEYHYEFRGQPFQGSRVWLSSQSDSGRFHGRVALELEQYQNQQKAFRCFVDQDDPSQSILYRDFRPEILLFHFVIVISMGGIGVGGLYGIYAANRQTKRIRTEAELRPDEPWTWDSQTASGVYHSKPQWIAYLLGAILWNVICWPFSYFVIMDAENGTIRWLMLLCALAGLWLAWKAAQVVLQRFRLGTVQLCLHPWPHFVGQPLQGTIEFSRMSPGSEELIFELQVLEPVPGDDPDKVLFKETVQVRNAGLSTMFEMHPRADLPRSQTQIDDTSVGTAKWILKVTGSDGPHDFDALFLLATFCDKTKVGNKRTSGSQGFE